MSFGFDASVILAGMPKPSSDSIIDNFKALSEMATQRAHQQQYQAQLGDLLRKREQEATLAQIYQRNAGSMPEGLPRMLAERGFGKQAAEWQDQDIQNAKALAEQQKAKREAEIAYRRYIGERAAAVKDQAGLDALRQEFVSSGDGFLASYAPQLPETFTPEGIKPIADQALAPEKRAEFVAAKERAEIMAGRPQPVVLTGEGGEQSVVDLRRPTKPGVTARGEEGDPIRKPPPTAGAGGVKDWKDFTTGVKTGGGLSKDLQKSINSAEAIEALLKMPNGQFAEATPQQMHEAYTALNNLISKGGSQAASQIEALVPDTLASKWANIKQTVLNSPQSADAHAFIENLLDTTHREAQLAKKQLRRQQLQGIPNYAHLRAADKKRFDAILKGVGIDPASVDDAGNEVAPPAGGGHPKDSAAVEWARGALKTDPKNKQAKEILEMNGVK